MRIEKTKQSMNAILEEKRTEGTIGFVPTMGALHEGHLSLVQRSVKENNYTVVSIFVNPTQFNNSNDLETYPRTLEADIALLEAAGCDMVFAPEVKEMYPEPDQRSFDFGDLETVMEGEMRPGHFNGVGQVVSKLFDYVRPHRAYFGMKDFQQVAIIQKLVALLELSVEIVSCDIIREDDGLAKSSRNTLLTPEHRLEAPNIYKALLEAVKFSRELTVKETIQKTIDKINESSLLEVEYFSIVNNRTLQPIKKWEEAENAVGCIAVQAGAVRLIDNIVF
ncbi:pantoate--beta-alanine ligase [Halosquirtibacter xylanolyticus]|uniref:pantoate--beta-alanine ligase n=1 Tax=Halosquirtibacter xylanolyticus TaxID=3374599 RepID=UPI00374A57A9|nr:pantoate--beta-alanine ligase [Prolixibacteraceae bacterium]